MFTHTLRKLVEWREAETSKALADGMVADAIDDLRASLRERGCATVTVSVHRGPGYCELTANGESARG